MLHEGTRYGVSVLADGQAGLSDRFAGREREDVPEPRFVTVRETPLVDGALAHLVARVVRSYWGGDHSLFLGQVEYARYGEGRPLLFHRGQYERIVDDPGVFSALPKALLDPLLARGEEVTFTDGETVMRLGEPAGRALPRARGRRPRRAPGAADADRPRRARRRDRGARRAAPAPRTSTPRASARLPASRGRRSSRRSRPTPRAGWA